MRSYLVVGFWASGLVVLAGVLFAFTPHPVVAVMFLFFIGLVAAFGLAVQLAVRRGREHAVQQRQPRRATAAAFLGIAAGIASLGLAYGWVLPLLAIYPLGVAAWMLRGERLPAGARPWPVAPDGAPPADREPLPYHGETVGESVPLPQEHPAHAPGRPPAPPAEQPLSTGAKVGWTVVALRTVGQLLRRARRGPRR